DGIRASDVAQHFHGDLAGKRALLFPEDILSRNGYPRPVCFFDSGSQGCKRRSHDDFAMLNILNFRNQSVKERARLGERLKHFPITGNDRTSHYAPLLVSTSTPGSFCPDKNSSAAPPPVDTCEIFASTPA